MRDSKSLLSPWKKDSFKTGFPLQLRDSKSLLSPGKEDSNKTGRPLQLRDNKSLQTNRHTGVIRTEDRQPVCEIGREDCWALTTSKHATLKTSSLETNGLPTPVLGLSSMKMAQIHQWPQYAQGAEPSSGKLRQKACAVRMARLLHPHSLTILIH